jgi:hypothetical protein
LDVVVGFTLAGGGFGVCELPVKRCCVESENDELCPYNRLWTARLGERNVVGEEEAKCQTR